MRTWRLAGIVLAAFILVTSACAGQGQESATNTSPVTGAFDWKRFSGQEITLLLNEHPWTDGVQPLIPEFEKLTGIKVNVQTFSEDLYFDKMEQALRSSSPVADVYFLPMDSTGYTQYQAGLIAPLSPYSDNPSLTASDYDISDFPEGFISVVKYPPGAAETQIYGIPITFETYILFYNKELVDGYLGGQVPQTKSKLVADAQKITDEANGDVYGAVMRGETLAFLELNHSSIWASRVLRAQGAPPELCVVGSGVVEHTIDLPPDEAPGDALVPAGRPPHAGPPRVARGPRSVEGLVEGGDRLTDAHRSSPALRILAGVTAMTWFTRQEIR
jgi:ABC-type glycerol-3-phosphate transport system substrate-binding protein